MNTNTLRALWDITGDALIAAASQQKPEPPPGTTNEGWLLIGIIAWAIIAVYYFALPFIKRHRAITRQAMRRWEAIDELRGPDGSGHQLILSCDDDEEVRACIACCAEWTEWKDREFRGRTIDDCLKEALLEKRTHDRARSMREDLLRRFPAIPGQPEQPEHHLNCDVHDRPPEGIIKPCNCGADPASRSAGIRWAEETQYGKPQQPRCLQCGHPVVEGRNCGCPLVADADAKRIADARRVEAIAKQVGAFKGGA